MVSKVKLQDCSQYKTCSTCLGAKDPYCGWCSLENKCSLLGDCSHVQKGQKGQTTWQSYKAGRCTTITKVSPHQIQRTTVRMLDLEIDNLPNLPGSFLCTFKAFGRILETKATKTQKGVVCPTPQTDRLPLILPGEHHFTAKLSVRQGSGPDYVATNFTFYDCSRYFSCTECVSSPFPCDWCVDGHRCTHDTGENCRSEILVTGVNNIGPSHRSGPGFCPRINATLNGAVEILVPSGISKKINVRVDNIQRFILEKKFVCQFNIEGRVTQVPAQLVAHIIYCDAMEFTYTSRAPNTTASFAVIWDSYKPLDNPLEIHGAGGVMIQSQVFSQMIASLHPMPGAFFRGSNFCVFILVLVYRCRGMADNCGTCLALLPPKYNCGWCRDQESCEVKEQCGEPGKAVEWLNRNKTCPNPTIRSFQPTSGPFEGGTNVTILGINLGKSFADIEKGVIVAGIPCTPYMELYVNTKEIVCKVGKPELPLNEPISGPVTVTVLHKYTAVSPYDYNYVYPTITSIFPQIGPMSGGTKLEIRGEYMDAGSHIEAFLGDKPCRVIRTSKKYAECVTPASSRTGTAVLKMVFDAGERKFEKGLFEYRVNPAITKVESGAAGSGIPKGIPDGGIVITVKGNNLKDIQDPKFYVSVNGQDYVNRCHIVPEASNTMRCKSPVFPQEAISFESDLPVKLEYGLIMDNVTDLRNLSARREFQPFFLYPNPVYEPFTEDDGIKFYKNDYLTINGKNLDRASQESDVIVRIGAGYCNVTSLSRSQLTCRPPTTQPPALKADGQTDSDEIPQVLVVVGGNLEYKIGYLSYKSQVGNDGKVSKTVMISISLSGAVLVVLVIIIFIAYRRKSTESNRVLKIMQEQMDVLELRVASECKEAFAELQTEMTDLTSDVTSGGIPFLDYRSYAMKILFPQSDDHPVLREFDIPIDPMRKAHVEKGLRLFNTLILNKTFLLLFIRTLESNRYFSMRDRVNVASLIMVTLQSKMEYCSDIQKTLLAELIEKCLDGKSHPKLLLRRTESVAEKMLSAWFTFLLYKFLKECAGEPLFLLYRAIKQQVDKGPVDAITSEARYSLSEEKLIRQSITYKPMTVYVSMYPQTLFNPTYDPHAENMDIPVKVLDCDTISQVKDKALDTIYKYHPYSQRPYKEDLDLVLITEWRTGTSGRLILSDDDATTRPVGEWKQLNTLGHYKVPDGALLTLVTKQSSIYNQTILSDKSDKSHKYETLNFSFKASSPPTSRATSPLNHDCEPGFKLWHLVKHNDGDHQKEGDRGNKMVSEIYLTRLLSTKGTLQKFVDDLFETIFSTAHRGSALPLAIKYMFDFLDDQALQHGIQDPEVVHTWKSNSLPLRFWVNLIKNPNFVFDISKSNIVDSCLSVVAQTFMDSCSTSDHRLGKDSPSSKLLYAKDIPIYKEWVERYYQDIKMMPAISDQDMNAMLAEESRLHANEFNTQNALHELYSYAVKYNDLLTQTLEEDEFSSKNRLASKLEQVHSIMAGESDA
ncbi:Plexin-A4 [Nymphon striatum]|nr:Plexin-A4 [Nymphon striatum]